MRWAETGALLLGITACGFSPGSGDGDDDALVFDAPGTTGDAGGGDGPGSIDAMTTTPIDATPPPNCPGEFVLERGSSRYFVSSEQTTWLDAEATCEALTAGESHLAVLGDDGEWAFFRDEVLVLSGDRYHVGVVRNDDSSSLNAWRYVTGGPATFVPWRHYYIGGNDEPNNGLGTPPSEPVATLDNSADLNFDPARGGFVDVEVVHEHRYICECDGRPPIDANYDP